MKLNIKCNQNYSRKDMNLSFLLCSLIVGMYYVELLGTCVIFFFWGWDLRPR
jgi:hypothetical protein